MKKVLKQITMTKELAENLEVINTDSVIKSIIDYLIEKTVKSRYDIIQAWDIAKEYTQKQYPEFDENLQNIHIDWSTFTIKIVEL